MKYNSLVLGDCISVLIPRVFANPVHCSLVRLRIEIKQTLFFNGLTKNFHKTLTLRAPTLNVSAGLAFFV